MVENNIEIILAYYVEEKTSPFLTEDLYLCMNLSTQILMPPVINNNNSLNTSLHPSLAILDLTQQIVPQKQDYFDNLYGCRLNVRIELFKC